MTDQLTLHERDAARRTAFACASYSTPKFDFAHKPIRFLQAPRLRNPQRCGHCRPRTPLPLFPEES